MEHLILGTLGNRQMEFDIKIGVLATILVQASFHLSEEFFDALQVRWLRTLGCQSRKFSLQDQPGFADILEFLFGLQQTMRQHPVNSKLRRIQNVCSFSGPHLYLPDEGERF